MGGTFSFEPVEFEVPVGYPSLGIQEEVQSVGLLTGMDLGIIHLLTVTKAYDIGSMWMYFC